MKYIRTVNHAPGAPGLRFLGLGPFWLPCRGLKKLKNLLDNEAFWAVNRSEKNLRKMLSNSSEVISLWSKNKLIGFGRATSDHVFRAVLWDIVIKSEYKGHGLGKMIVNSLLKRKSIKNVQKVYLMSTNNSGFYKQLGFKISDDQNLMYLLKKEKS